MPDVPERNFAAVRASLVSPDPVMMEDAATAPNIKNNALKSNKEVLSAVFGAVAANQFADVPQYLTDDVELHIQGFPGMDGAWRGRDEVMTAMKANFSKVTGQAPQIETLVEQDDSLAMLLTETGKLAASGESYNVRLAVWYTFQGGRIRKVEQFVHSKPPAAGGEIPADAQTR